MYIYITSGLPDRVLLGQNSPSVGMTYLVVPLKLDVTLAGCIRRSLLTEHFYVILFSTLVKVALSGESSYSMSTTELHMSLRRNHPTSRQARNSPKFGSLFDQEVKVLRLLFLASQSFHWTEILKKHFEKIKWATCSLASTCPPFLPSQPLYT